MSALEEYKASIVFTSDKRIIVGRKLFDDKSARTFSHMIIAGYDCKEGKFILDREFRCDSSNPNAHRLIKLEDSNTRYSGQLPISHANSADGEILDLHVEFDIYSFQYMFELVRSVADLLQDENDKIAFEVYLYFIKH